MYHWGKREQIFCHYTSHFGPEINFSVKKTIFLFLWAPAPERAHRIRVYLRHFDSDIPSCLASSKQATFKCLPKFVQGWRNYNCHNAPQYAVSKQHTWLHRAVSIHCTQEVGYFSGGTPTSDRGNSWNLTQVYVIIHYYSALSNVFNMCIYLSTYSIRWPNTDATMLALFAIVK